MDGVGRANFYEQSEEGEDAADEECNDEGIDDEEDGEASPHSSGGGEERMGDEGCESRRLASSPFLFGIEATRRGGRMAEGSELSRAIENLLRCMWTASRWEPFVEYEDERQRLMQGGSAID